MARMGLSMMRAAALLLVLPLLATARRPLGDELPQAGPAADAADGSPTVVAARLRLPQPPAAAAATQQQWSARGRYIVSMHGGGGIDGADDADDVACRRRDPGITAARFAARFAGVGQPRAVFGGGGGGSSSARRAAAGGSSSRPAQQPRQQQPQLFHGFTLSIADAARGTADEARALAALRADPCVLSVEPDGRVAATVVSAAVATGETVPVGVKRLRAAMGGKVHAAAAVDVAVLDTGIDYRHPDLNVVGGADCTDPAASACSTAGGRAAYLDNNDHGTHVAGTIAAKNGGGGVVGVVPNTRLFAVKVLDANGYGDDSALIRALQWVQTHNRAVLASNSTAAASKRLIRVVNLSLSGSSDAGSDRTRLGSGCKGGTALHRAACLLSRDPTAGSVIVAAAGNSADALDVNYPGSYPEVLAVTAMADSDGQAGGLGGNLDCGDGYAYADDSSAPWSSFAQTGSNSASHVVAAPGACIKSTVRKGKWGVLSGTSMACPHVAGAVAACFGSSDGGGGAGPCAGAFASGGGSDGVIKMLVSMAAYRQTGAAGFVGDAASCSGAKAGCRHLGSLLDAKPF